MTAILAQYERKSIFKGFEHHLNCFLGNTPYSLTIFCVDVSTIL